jgi:hypothetical protein
LQQLVVKVKLTVAMEVTIGQWLSSCFDRASERIEMARCLRLLFFIVCVPGAVIAGNQGRGPILMNPAAAAQMQNTRIAAQIRSAQNAAHALSQNGISVIKGNNGITLVRLNDPTLVPSNALRTFQSSDGKTYAIDGNGVIFGGSSPVNTRALSAAAMGATSNGPLSVEEQQREKPSRTTVPSIVTVEVVRFGEK